jgi:CRP/FNR family transcriptional regulator, cyclic AMP receptor protein
MELEQAKNGTHRNIRNLVRSAIAMPTGLQRFKAFLQACSLSANVIDDFLQRHMMVSFPKNAFIFRQGTPGDVIYWVKAGLVDVLCSDSRRGNLIVEIATPGDLLGFMDFVDASVGCRQMFDARARTRCEIGILTRDRIDLALAQLSAEALVSLGEHINDWWSEKIKYWVKFAALSARERLELVLSRLGEKCGVDDIGGTLIVPEFSHEDFALMIASSRPMVSRLLAAMVAEGRLLRRHRRYILCKAPGEYGSASSDAAATQ